MLVNNAQPSLTLGSQVKNTQSLFDLMQAVLIAPWDGMSTTSFTRSSFSHPLLLERQALRARLEPRYEWKWMEQTYRQQRRGHSADQSYNACRRANSCHISPKPNQ